MNVLLQPSGKAFREAVIKITGSKSESNRVLLLQALYPSIVIENSSNSEDTQVMRRALQTSGNHIDIHHAGTAMRFLTAFFATQAGREVVITGSKRMKERPIAILVDALRTLGADIHYEAKEGYPPLRIKGKKLQGHRVTLKANISSQYISALLLIAPTLPNGLELTLEGTITSVPYIEMTLALLREVGVAATFDENRITVKHKSQHKKTQSIIVESDWSSASYFYSSIALSAVGTRLTLSSYKKQSLQGDAALAEIYTQLGVSTEYFENAIILTKNIDYKPSEKSITLNLVNTPDIAQTIAVGCFGMGIGCRLSGLHTLKIKETDRLYALQKELTKLGATISVTDTELMLATSTTIRKNITISTYDDHRMAMAFAPLGLKVPIIINNAEVVSKSYPDFWKDIKKLEIDIKEIS